MSVRRFLIVAAIGTGLPAASGIAQQNRPDAAPRETSIRLPGASLYVRTIGRGPSVLVLHGGPDFDTSYLLPEMDALSDGYRLIYYDQRGRGKSAEKVHAEDITLATELADLDAVRQHSGLESVVVLGHSWGAVLALEYALRHPNRVSRLILLNPAPASASDRQMLVTSYLEQLGPDMERQNQIRNGKAYKEGDPDAVAARYRIHFEHAFARTADYEKVMLRMDSAFHRQGKAGILKARTAEDKLYRDTWERAGYDLMPRLRGLRIPTMVIVSDRDFIPSAIGEHIAQAIPGAKLVTLEDCGHFSYLECAPQVRRALDGFLRGGRTSRPRP